MRRLATLGACWVKLMVFSTDWIIRLFCAFAARFLLKCNSPKVSPLGPVIYNWYK